MSTFKGSEQNISQLIAVNSIYVIPSYQRDYKWHKEHVERFFMDIKDTFLKGEDMSYFIGSLILVEKKEDNKKNVEIIDGQQRMTTIFLLLKALRHYFEHKQETTFVNQVDIILYDFSKQELKIKIEPREPLKKMPNGCRNFKEFIQKNHNDIINLSESEKANLYIANYLYLVDELNKFEKDISSFFEFFLYNVQVVKIECQTLVNAIKVFDTINSTGLDLSSSDIIKSRIMLNNANSDFKEIDSIWSDIEEKAKDFKSGRGDPMDILLNNFFLYQYQNYEGGVIEKFNLIQNTFNIKEFINFVDYCQKITQEECPFILALKHLNWDSSWMPLLAKGMIYYADEKKYITFKKNITKLCYSYFLAGRRADAILPNIKSLIKNLDQNIFSLIEDNHIKEIENLLKLNDIYTDTTYRKKCTASFILLETFYNDNTSLIIKNAVSLDHLIPKSSNDAENIHCIGNLVLMSKDKNSRFGNKSNIESKKKSYDNSSFNYAKNSFETSFTKDNIENRKKKIISDLLNIFKK
jgi:uncharacterized protein with ParB-like and HNH nuclease domain